jgi:hypothetical protein
VFYRGIGLINCLQELQFAKSSAWKYAMASTNKLAVAKRLCSAGCRKSLYGDLLTVAPAIFAGHVEGTLDSFLVVVG